MWSLLRVCCVALGLFSLTACGFEPVYADRTDQYWETSDLLASVSVVAPKNQRGEQLKAAVEDLINPQARADAPNYRLELGVKMDSQPFIFNADGTAGRYNITLTVPYVLYRMADNAPSAKGRVRRIVSYNVSEEDDYATYISMQDAMRRVTNEVAEDIKMRLSAHMAKML